jgi:O-antigen/teichoic acid export membrane protein
MNMKLSKTASNVTWVLATQGGVRLLTMVRGIVLARILDPIDYGIVGAALILHDMLQVFGNMGIKDAVVYLQKKTDEVLPVATVMTCCFSLLLAVAVYFMAPLWASIFERDEVTSVSQFSALFVLATIFAFPADAQAQVGLRFKELLAPKMVAAGIGSGVAISLALSGFSYWSIMWGILANRLLEAILLIRVFPWRIRLTWNSQLATELWKYASHMMAATMLNFAILQVDNLLVGKFLGLTALGYYMLAFRWANFGSQEVASGIGSVLFPTFSHWRATERNPVAMFNIIMRVSAALYMPICVGMLVIAPEFVSTVLGARWMPAVVPLQILCIAAVFRSIGNPIGKLLQATGHPELLVRFQFGLLLTILVFLPPLSLQFGLVGASYGVLIAAITWHFLVPVALLQKVMGIALGLTIRALLPSIVASGVMVSGILITKTLLAPGVATLGFLALLIVLGAILYLSTIYSLLSRDISSLLRSGERNVITALS